MTDEEQTAFCEGQAAGGDLACTAGDCPYPIGDGNTRRGAWLDGFSHARPDVSRASDPSHARGRFEPARPSAHQTPHAG